MGKAPCSARDLCAACCGSATCCSCAAPWCARVRLVGSLMLIGTSPCLGLNGVRQCWSAPCSIPGASWAPASHTLAGHAIAAPQRAIPPAARRVGGPSDLAAAMEPSPRGRVLLQAWCGRCELGVHPRHDPDQHRLSRALRTDDADLRAGEEGQVDALQDVLAAADLPQFLHRIDEVLDHALEKPGAGAPRGRAERPTRTSEPRPQVGTGTRGRNPSLAKRVPFRQDDLDVDLTLSSIRRPNREGGRARGAWWCGRCGGCRCPWCCSAVRRPYPRASTRQEISSFPPIWWWTSPAKIRRGTV
jgi:hypothetical protein